MTPACAKALPGDRWHFQHGPIDLILLVRGDATPCRQALADCWDEFQRLLELLVRELPMLRKNAVQEHQVSHPVAKLMVRACEPYWRADHQFITPMAAVAGSVAQHLLHHFERDGVRRAAINNGGDIAFHLRDRERFNAGVVGNIEEARVDTMLQIDSDSPVRGVATSGWQGRSLSLGIAESVTVLAASASQADAAATMIANAVNSDHPAILRSPASSVRDDSDLGDLLVTRGVGPLPQVCVDEALQAGLDYAQRLKQRGQIVQASLWCQGRRVVTS
jgi:hypothetical protein